MFGKKKEPMVTVCIYGDIYEVHPEIRDAVNNLKIELDERRQEIAILRSELDGRTVNEGKLSPAISKMCRSCKYCITSIYNGVVLGCNHGCVCEYFVPDREEY